PDWKKTAAMETRATSARNEWPRMLPIRSASAFQRDRRVERVARGEASESMADPSGSECASLQEAGQEEIDAGIGMRRQCRGGSVGQRRALADGVDESQGWRIDWRNAYRMVDARDDGMLRLPHHLRTRRQAMPTGHPYRHR